MNTTADGATVPFGKLDLRGAINLANVLSGTNPISFSPSVFATAQTINLTAGQLVMSNTAFDESIIGPAAGVTVNGGGISRVLQINPSVTAIILGLTLTGGGGDAVLGGGVLVLAGASLSLSNCTISGNTAAGDGGGIASYGTIIVSDCTVSGNTAAGNGGAIDSDNVFGTATMSLLNCTISGNASGLLGGGLYSRGGGATVNSCTINNNTATGAGGGVASKVAMELITNCTLTGNKANGGGGLYNAGTTSVRNCTITANSGGAGGGGGLLNSNGKLTLDNTIVAGNTNGSTPAAASDIAGAIAVSGTFNLIGTGGSGGLVNGVSGNIVGVADPGLSKLGLYGGITQTMALLPGSMAIGRGTALTGITTDQRGLPPSSPPDIGAFQVQSGPLGWQVNTTADGAFGKIDLRGAINLANVLPGALTITFSPTVFGSAKTITLTKGQLELSNTGGVQTITGTAAGVTVSGGGLNRVFEIDQNVTAFLSGMTITGGGGTADRGGGVLNLGNVTLTNCTVSGNTASRNGGGIASYATLTLVNSMVSNNVATTGKGGGIANFVGATLTDSSVSNNSAPNSGGVFNSGTMTMTNCAVSGNKATTNAGGLGNYGTLSMTNGTVANNSATTAGGILGAGTTTLTFCTISGNTASAGGGLENRSGSATLTDTIVARNTNTSKPAGASDITGAVGVTGTFNLIGTGGSGGLKNGVSGNIVGVTDPDLGSLGPYGGPTQTMALLPGSVAIGKGTAVNGVTTDGRGLPRAQRSTSARTRRAWSSSRLRGRSTRIRQI